MTLYKFIRPILFAITLNLFLAPYSFGDDEVIAEESHAKDLSLGIGYLGTFQNSSDSHAVAVDLSWDAWTANPNFILILDVMGGALKANEGKTVMSLGAFLELELAQAWLNPISFSLIGGVQQWDFNDDLTTYGVGLNYKKAVGPMDQIFLKYLSSELAEGSETISNSQAYLGLSRAF